MDPVEVKLEQLRAAIDNAQELQVPYADLWNARQALQRAGFAQQHELAQHARRDLAQRELRASCESPLDVLALELVTKSLKGFKDQEGKLDESINETFLLHGTNGGVLLKILSNGLTEKFAGSTAGTLYGDGIYFPEDVTKSDQYVKPDMKYDATDSKLHRIVLCACLRKKEEVARCVSRA